MKTKTALNILYRQMGTWREVAESIGITMRYVHFLRKRGNEPGRFLAERIDQKVKALDIIEE
jgi:hypothetical protein